MNFCAARLLDGECDVLKTQDLNVGVRYATFYFFFFSVTSSVLSHKYSP